MAYGDLVPDFPRPAGGEGAREAAAPVARAACLALLQTRLGFPPEIFAALAQPLILGSAGCLQRRVGDVSGAARDRERALVFAVRAVMVRQDRILPPNAPPEMVGELAHRWTYAVLVAALLRSVETAGAGGLASLHDRIVPEVGQRWLRQDQAVTAALTDVLSGCPGPDNPIAAILREVVGGAASGQAGLGETRGLSAPDAEDRGAQLSTAGSGMAPDSVSATTCGGSCAVASATDARVSRFFGWLGRGITSASIPVNTRSSFVHRVREGLLVVWPDAFRSFLEAQRSSVPALRSMQRLRQAVLDAGWHLESADGSGVHRYAWREDGRPAAMLEGVVITSPHGLLDPLPPINPRLVRIAVAGGSDP
jgi:hypothetical protein